MSAPWRCDLCGRGDDDEEHPPFRKACDCITVRAADWAAMLILWSKHRVTYRAGSIKVEGIDLGERLDALFFEGCKCSDRPNVLLPRPTVLGGDSCR